MAHSEEHFKGQIYLMHIPGRFGFILSCKTSTLFVLIFSHLAFEKSAI